MKTLFWTGSVCESASHGQQAVWRWWNYYRQHREALGVTHWCVFNDGSDNLPVEWFVDKQDAQLNPVQELKPDRLNLIYFSSHLGRTTIHQVPGFWRNLLTAVEICREQAFDRFILVEYDCLILSPEMLFEVGNTQTGMTCYWCPTYNMPETSVVICGKDRFQRTEEQALAIFTKEAHTEADRFETAMDWTEIRRHRKGDRYPEIAQPVPVDADYLCQLPINGRLAWGRRVEYVQ